MYERMHVGMYIYTHTHEILKTPVYMTLSNMKCPLGTCVCVCVCMYVYMYARNRRHDECVYMYVCTYLYTGFLRDHVEMLKTGEYLTYCRESCLESLAPHVEFDSLWHSRLVVFLARLLCEHKFFL